MTEKRIIELESRLAYQEDTILVLNKMVFEQQQRIEKLELAYRGLAERTMELSTLAGKSLDEKPPHY